MGASGLQRIAPWRFLLFFALLLAGLGVGPLILHASANESLLVGFDVAAVVFLVSCIPTFQHAPADIRTLAERSDANRVVLLVINALVTVVIFVALVGEVGLRGKLDPSDKLLIVITLVLAWTFGNAVYTLHYAHLFYAHDAKGSDRGGLEFPGTEEPIMSDFAYFAFTLGVAVQTSDVQVTSRHIRKVVTAHAVTGFFFNLGALALAINLLAAG